MTSDLAMVFNTCTAAKNVSRGYGNGGICIDTEEGILFKVLPVSKKDEVAFHRQLTDALPPSVAHHVPAFTGSFTDTETNLPVLAMEYIQGQTLDQLLRNKVVRVNELLPFYKHTVVPVLQRLINEGGFYHGDENPRNILIKQEGVELLKNLKQSTQVLTKEGWEQLKPYVVMLDLDPTCVKHIQESADQWKGFTKRYARFLRHVNSHHLMGDGISPELKKEELLRLSAATAKRRVTWAMWVYKNQGLEQTLESALYVFDFLTGGRVEQLLAYWPTVHLDNLTWGERWARLRQSFRK
ncbi:MAG: hypothetical protein ACKO34_07835 [Vampirovibrionales bacterium]